MKKIEHIFLAVGALASAWLAIANAYILTGRMEPINPAYNAQPWKIVLFSIVFVGLIIALVESE